MSENLIPTDEDPRDIKEIFSNYEKLITSTQRNLEDIKKDHILVKEEVSKILIENRSHKCPTVDHSALEDSARENRAITDEVISNLKYQIEHNKQERDTAYSLWNISQETITALESEIQSYRNQLFKPDAVDEIKQKYASTIALLEETIRSQRAQLAKQISINKHVVTNQAELEEKIRGLEQRLIDKDKEIATKSRLDDANTDLRNHLDSVMRVNSDLQESLLLAKQVIDERFSRETCALEKINEALYIAEKALGEKEEAIKREALIKEECQHLASTVGEVMDEAACKVEKNIDELKKQHEKKVKELVAKQKETETLAENQKKATEKALLRYATLETKFREVSQANISLDSDLQMASQAIIELELKLEALEKLLNKSHSKKILSEERENELEHYLLNNKQIRERWKTAVEDVTTKFEDELLRLRSENIQLKTEIEELRLRL